MRECFFFLIINIKQHKKASLLNLHLIRNNNETAHFRLKTNNKNIKMKILIKLTKYIDCGI